MAKKLKSTFKPGSNVAPIHEEVKQGNDVKLSGSEVEKFKAFDYNINTMKLKHADLRTSFLLSENAILKKIQSVNEDRNKDVHYIIWKNGKDPKVFQNVEIDTVKMILKLR